MIILEKLMAMMEKETIWITLNPRSVRIRIEEA
jgi:hypothetical protein